MFFTLQQAYKKNSRVLISFYKEKEKEKKKKKKKKKKCKK